MASYPTVELYVNSTWTDITSYVRYNDMINITRGQSGEGGKTDTSTCSLTLDNSDGRFSPRNATGVYYGQIGRNTPIRVSVDGGESYLNCPGASGDRVSTPDAAALDITGDIDVRIELSNTDWDTDDTQELIGKYNTTGNQRSWRLEIIDGGYPRYHWSNDGTTVNTVTATNTIVSRGMRRVAIRVTHDVDDGSGNNVVTFYTSGSISGTWTQLGTVITTSGTTSIFSSTADLQIADIANLNFDPLIARVHKASVRSGIAGAEVANPDFTTQTPGASSFVDGAGRTWTMAGNATIMNRKERFTGEVSAWPVTSDITGTDITVQVDAAGILRRLGQGASPLDSAILRFAKSEFIYECWPLTDGPLSDFGEPLNDGTRMIPNITSGTALPGWGQGKLADWIEPVVQLPLETDGTIRGYVANQSGAASSWAVDFCYAGTQEIEVQIVDRGDHTDADPTIAWTVTLLAGTDEVELFVASIGETTTSSATPATITGAGIFDGQPHHIRLTISNTGADADYVIYIDGVQEASGTAVGYASEAVLYIRPGWFLSAATSDAPSIGFVTYMSLGGPSASEAYSALIGHRGENAGDRIARLCEEEDITYQRIGSDDTPEMGPQGMDQLVDLLRECETADQGILFEPRDAVGLAYRDRASLYNQDVKLDLTYSNHELSAPLNPVEDDQNTRNDVTISQLYGINYRTTLDSGTLSTQAPPNGVGRYDESITVSLNDANFVSNYAGWKLHLGTVDEARYPQVSLNLRHSTFSGSSAMMEKALTIDIGDRLTIDGVPSWWPPDDVTQLYMGASESLGGLERDLVLNCVPESPYHVAVADSSTLGRADTAGSTISSGVDSDDTSFTVATSSGPVWVDSATYASEFPFDCRIGGEVVTVTAIAGTTSPQTFTVTRSVNGVVKAHSSGASISLDQPAKAAL